VNSAAPYGEEDVPAADREFRGDKADLDGQADRRVIRAYAEQFSTAADAVTDRPRQKASMNLPYEPAHSVASTAT
jgi:hypothetical protein